MGKQAFQPASLSEVELLPRETAEENTPRQLSEQEHQAILADRVDRETAALKADNDRLKTENAELQDKVDVAESARVAEQQKREQAEQELVDYKAEQEQAKEIAERRDARVAKVREVAAHLKDDFFTPERAQRWAAMDEEVFETYRKEIAEAAGVQTPVVAGNQPPRETAMHGAPVTPRENQRGNAQDVLAIRRGV